MVPLPDHTPRELLDFYLEAGADALVGEEPVDRFAPVEQAPAPPRPARQLPDSAMPSRAAPAMAPQAPDEAALAAREAAKSAKSLEELRSILEKFDGCALKATATQLVFADGNPKSKVMFVGEAPGRDEDIEGLPFVGRSGKLLDRMLAAIGLDRTSVYIANIVPWRQAGNTRDADVPSGISAAQPAAEAFRLARLPGDQEGTERLKFQQRRTWRSGLFLLFSRNGRGSRIVA
jgi:hypothetical protein